MNQQNPNQDPTKPFFTGGDRMSTAPDMRNAKTIPLGTPPPAANMGSEAGDKTMPMPGESGVTRPYVPFEPKATAPMPGRPAASRSASAKDLGPVTGWLVIVSGPGRGRSLELGFGRNSIGRGPNNEVVVAYGDPGISNEHHVFVSYDALSRKFFISEGMSRNLAYCNGNPVFGYQELQQGSQIRISETMFVFVQFCGSGVDWSSFPEQLSALDAGRQVPGSGASPFNGGQHSEWSDGNPGAFPGKN